MPFGSQQFFVSSLLYDLSVLDHKDYIRVLDGGQSVGDHDGRASLDDLFYGCLDPLFRDRVDRSCSLVQNNDLRLSDDGPREGYELLLTGREQVSALAYVCIKTILQLIENALERQKIDGILYLFLSGVGSAVYQIIPDRSREKMR